VDLVIKGALQQDGSQVRTVVSQDPGQAGVAQVQALARFVAPMALSFVKETGEKSTRARGLASQAEVGNVYLVEGSWNEEFLEELCTFPMGGHDDQVDAASGAFSDLFGGNDGYLGWMQQQAANALG
jgi:predicted phage terminase large subunit-like protein